MIGKPEKTFQTEAGTAAATAPSRTPEARYAYYRRCRHFRRNGEQCKAPATKGEAICYRHAEQADNERRREEQRRELLSRPGVGFESFEAIQRTLSELGQSIYAGTIDRKVAGRLIVDILNAIRLQKMLTLAQESERVARSRFVAAAEIGRRTQPRRCDLLIEKTVAADPRRSTRVKAHRSSC